MSFYNKNFDMPCRACATSKFNLLSLYIKEGINEEPTLAEMFSSVTGSSKQIQIDDGLPTHICYTCARKLEEAYNFQQACQKNDLKLRGITSDESLPTATEETPRSSIRSNSSRSCDTLQKIHEDNIFVEAREQKIEENKNKSLSNKGILSLNLTSN